MNKSQKIPSLAVGLILAAAVITATAEPPDRALTSPATWGNRIVGGPAGINDRRVDLSAAHALVREFSVDSAFATSDTALATALKNDQSLTVHGLLAALKHYAAQLSDVQVVAAGPASIGPAQIQMFGPVALIRPGTGTVALPAGAEMVVIDMRNLPAITDLAEILPRMAAPAMKNAVTPLGQLVRTHRGPVDEVFSRGNVYRTGLGIEQARPFPATGPVDLPIVLLVGRRIAPQAAAFAAAMRVARRAWIVGASVPLSVAESTWRGVGLHGLAVRTSTMVTERAPDVFTDQIATQDDPFDPSMSYRREFTVTNAVELDVSIDAADSADLDLYLVHDANNDGVFDLFGDELVAYSATESADEAVTLLPVKPGRYQALVHGYFVPGGTIPFTLRISTTIPLPDEIPADLAVGEDALDGFPNDARRLSGGTPPPVSGSAARSSPGIINAFDIPLAPIENGRGELRAGLLITHGVARLFYRYFSIVGDTIDERLLETLVAADAHDGSSRISAWRILRRFGEALHDGHQFVFPNPRLHPTSLPVFLEHIGGRPVVRRSRAAGIQPGDTIVALEGRPIEDVYAEELARTSAATPGYQLDIADRYIYAMSGPLTLTLQDPDGLSRTVTVAPQPFTDYLDVVERGESDRPSGPLTDLGAPGLYYLNLNSFTTASPGDMRAALAQAAALRSTGMVVDMRGYPGVNHYEVAQRLIQETFLSPVFEHNVFTGPDHKSVLQSQYSPEPLGAPAFAGPIVLLTGHHTVSAAENFAQMLVGANRPVAVAGRRSAGTNGNITGVKLPGGFSFTYTGMELRNPDGSLFHGVGIVPDVDVPLTVQDLRDGIDRDLLTAISLLQ